MDKQTLQFLGLDVPKIDHSLLTKEAHGTLGLYDIVAQIDSTTDEKIQEIVRTNSSNKYWIKPSTTTLTELSSK